VGGGIFADFSLAPSRLAWDAFGEKNGAATYEAMRRRIEKYRRMPPSPHEEYDIGCVLLSQPFFFGRSNWIPAPFDFAKNIVQGKTYDLTMGAGKELWAAVQERLQTSAVPAYAAERSVYGDPVLVKQRLGQGTFRLLVTDTYQKRCAVTGEKVLPVLQAAHIRPVSEGGGHRVDNGLLLRSDVHTLFDRGYVSVAPDFRVLVSARLKKDFDNGEHYYQYREREICTPSAATDRPRSCSWSGTGTKFSSGELGPSFDELEMLLSLDGPQPTESHLVPVSSFHHELSTGSDLNRRLHHPAADIVRVEDQAPGFKTEPGQKVGEEPLVLFEIVDGGAPARPRVHERKRADDVDQRDRGPGRILPMQVTGDPLPGTVFLLFALDAANPEPGDGRRAHQLGCCLDIVLHRLGRASAEGSDYGPPGSQLAKGRRVPGASRWGRITRSTRQIRA
jgi:putative restriction endonuclease